MRKSSMKLSGPQASLMPLMALFLTGTLIVWILRKWLLQHAIYPTVLLVANVLFFLLSLLIHSIQVKSAANKNPNVFVRAVMGGTLIKMMVLLVAAGVYALAFRTYLNKASVFIAMCWYLVYLVFEARTSMRLNKSPHA